jgi:septation ring formation regulator EzrA
MKPLIFSFVGLLIIIALIYGTLRYLRSEKDKALAELEKEKNKVQTESVQNDSLTAPAKPLTKADSLTQIVDLYKKEITGKDSILDSLQNVVIEKSKIAQKQQKENQKSKKQEELAENARAMAKTFEKMSVKQIAPILENLDDGTVFMIYKATGNRFKKNILLAVKEKRAAQITEAYIHKN